MHCEIGGQRIGVREPLFVIAELGLNHGGSLSRALDLVEAAARAGASAIKLQTFRADDLVAPTCPAPAHVGASSLRDFFARFELDRTAHVAIRSRTRELGLAFIATPFSCAAVDMLDDLEADALKIASGDVTYDALIVRAARTGRPLILSTGMSTLTETAHAVSLARSEGARHLALLHCVSAYPVPEASQNLRAIQTLGRMFNAPVGLSDHAADTSMLPAAIALGACVYERHMMRAEDDGVDAAVSSTPEEMAAIVALAARAEAALGHGRRECLPVEAVNLTASRRSLHTTRALPAGHTVTADDIAVLRPSRGLSPSLQDDLVGSVLTRAVEAGAPFLGHDLASSRSQRGVA